MRADALPARLNNAGKHQCQPDWRLTPQQSRRWVDLDLWVLASGRGRVRTPEGDLDLEPGCCLLMRGGEDYHFHQSRTQPFVHYWAHFDYLGPDGEAMDHRTLRLPPRLRRLSSPRLLTDLFDRLVEAHLDPSSGAERAERWLAAMLMEVARADAETEPPDEASPHREAIEALRERILADPGADHRVEALAGEMGLDPSYFCRLFRRRVGLAPRQFITAARMETGRYLLRDTDLPVGHIAAMLGYHDVHFFSRHFRRMNGVSPTAYRRGDRRA